MRTETEIMNRIKELENRMTDEDKLSSFATPILRQIYELSWVLGKIEFYDGEKIKSYL